MKPGDKVLCEGVINMVGEGFCKVSFGKVGTQAVSHIRVLNDDIRPVPVKAPAKPVKTADAD